MIRDRKAAERRRHAKIMRNRRRSVSRKRQRVHVENLRKKAIRQMRTARLLGLL